jgi:hypothetical protein
MTPAQIVDKYKTDTGETGLCHDDDEPPYNDWCPNTAFMEADGVQPDDTPLFALPEPMDVRKVDNTGTDCWEDPSLVGTGDCSNTLWEPWLEKEGQAWDYTELRMKTEVPEGIDGLQFDFAFFSMEYPRYFLHDDPAGEGDFDEPGDLLNDMFVAWLESERWTGNISFDRDGNPISVKTVLFDYKDAEVPGLPCVPGPICNAEQLTGFAAENHGGTKWLTTSAPVQPGEEITLIFALFDNQHASFDSMVILDHFEWTCSGAPPFTAPAG